MSGDEGPLDEGYVNYCPDCGAMFGPDEDGCDTDICIECGESNMYEVPG